MSCIIQRLSVGRIYGGVWFADYMEDPTMAVRFSACEEKWQGSVGQWR